VGQDQEKTIVKPPNRAIPAAGIDPLPAGKRYPVALTVLSGFFNIGLTMINHKNPTGLSLDDVETTAPSLAGRTMAEKAEQMRDSSATGTDPEVITGQLHAMKQRMEWLYARNFDNDREGSAEPEGAAGDIPYQPPVDMWETDREWFILIDLPGVGQDDFQVEFVREALIIRGQRQRPAIPEGTAVTPPERPQGAFARSFLLPAEIEAEAIKAELKHGVLTVAITKDRGLPSAGQQVRVKTG